MLYFGWYFFFSRRTWSDGLLFGQYKTSPWAILSFSFSLFRLLCRASVCARARARFDLLKKHDVIERNFSSLHVTPVSFGRRIKRDMPSSSSLVNSFVSPQTDERSLRINRERETTYECAQCFLTRIIFPYALSSLFSSLKKYDTHHSLKELFFTITFSFISFLSLFISLLFQMIIVLIHPISEREPLRYSILFYEFYFSSMTRCV